MASSISPAHFLPVLWVLAGSLLTPATALQITNLLPFTKLVVYRHATLEEVLLMRLPPGGDSLVLVVGTKRPSKRASTQPVLTFSPEAASQVPSAVQQMLQDCMQHLAAMGLDGRFGLQLDVLPPSFGREAGKQAAALNAPPSPPPPGPVAVFDASTGRVLLGQPLLTALQSSPVHVVSAAVQATTAAAQHLLQAAGQVMPGDVSVLLRLAPKAAAAGLAAAFLATVPKWFCFVCPIVLGLLSPLVINGAVGEAADMACKAMQLPDDECLDLWWTALGLGMILSLLSALPIYKVCRLYECAHPGPSAVAAVA